MQHKAGTFSAASLIGMAVLAWAFGSAAQAARRQGPDVLAGRHIAQRYCGGCHAVGAERSPLADAPPFRRLYRRYGRQTLGDLLHEGMLAPPGAQDEAEHDAHPRMPTVKLDLDEIAELTRERRSVEPFAYGRGH